MAQSGALVVKRRAPLKKTYWLTTYAVSVCSENNAFMGDVMVFQISVEPSQHHFEIGEDESILDAALRQGADAAPLTAQLAGFIRVRAADLTAAQALVAGNPVYECGGTVEVRELPLD